VCAQDDKTDARKKNLLAFFFVKSVSQGRIPVVNVILLTNLYFNLF
jgi:hypothetical protein